MPVHSLFAHMHSSWTHFYFPKAIQDQPVFSHTRFERVLVCGKKGKEEIRDWWLPGRKQLPKWKPLLVRGKGEGNRITKTFLVVFGQDRLFHEWVFAIIKFQCILKVWTWYATLRLQNVKRNFKAHFIINWESLLPTEAMPSLRDANRNIGSSLHT